MPIIANGYAAFEAKGDLKPFTFTRRDLRPDDVKIEIKYCGVCHTDIHTIDDDFCMAQYPCVAGQEITGIVTEIGSDVTKFKVGDRAGVGIFCGSCGKCPQCVERMEQYCASCVWTANGVDEVGDVTHGGYSNIMVTGERFTYKIPDALPLDRAAPLLGGGATIYSACRFYGFDQPGKRIGVYGLGGIGHLAVQFLKAFGAEPVVLSHSLSKKEDAQKLGASEFINMNHREEVDKHKESLDGLIDTVCGRESPEESLGMIKVGGSVAWVGVGKALRIPSSIIWRRKRVGGSFAGGTKETQEMLDFCAEKQVLPWIEKIKIDEIKEAHQRMESQDVKYRFVIDMTDE